MDTRFTPPYDGFAVGRDVLFHRPSSCPHWVSPYRARRQALAGIRYAAAARPANQVSGILDRPIKSGRPQLGSRQISFQTAKRTHARLPATRRARVVRKLPPPKNRGRGECRVPSAPAASCALGVVSMHTSVHSGGTGITRHSRTRMVLTAYGELSPATNSSCHRRRQIDGGSAPGWADTPSPT
jgi:hypothetical protein